MRNDYFIDQTAVPQQIFGVLPREQGNASRRMGRAKRAQERRDEHDVANVQRLDDESAADTSGSEGAPRGRAEWRECDAAGCVYSFENSKPCPAHRPGLRHG